MEGPPQEKAIEEEMLLEVMRNIFEIRDIETTSQYESLDAMRIEKCNASEWELIRKYYITGMRDGE